jgi:hypothetical protein
MENERQDVIGAGLNIEIVMDTVANTKLIRRGCSSDASHKALPAKRSYGEACGYGVNGWVLGGRGTKSIRSYPPEYEVGRYGSVINTNVESY